jgi:hypothetical protein
MTYSVKLDWVNNPYMEYWNNICIWGIEHFGLPGDRYTTNLTEDYMIWNFRNPQDQLLFMLAWGNDGNGI